MSDILANESNEKWKLKKYEARNIIFQTVN